MRAIDTNLAEFWGWNQPLFAAWLQKLSEESGSARYLPGRVLRKEHHEYSVVCPPLRARLAGTGIEADDVVPGPPPEVLLEFSGLKVSGRFEHRAEDSSAYPVVGDWVLVEALESGSGRIQAILPRNTAIRRNVAGVETRQQVIAANISVLLLVFGLDGGRNFLVRFLERALTTAWNSGAQPIVVLNKADCAQQDAIDQAVLDAESAGFGLPVFVVSARTGQGIAELAAALRPGDTVGMLGKSGVGKSALLNALAAEGQSATGSLLVQAKTGDLRRDLQGRHTTSSAQLYPLATGVLVIDAPGLRELQLWADESDLDMAFPEIEELAADCKFGDCSHGGEPGCAVQEALSTGELPLERFAAYQDLLKELGYLERRQNQQARLAEKAKWKEIAKSMKNFKKPGRG